VGEGERSFFVAAAAAATAADASPAFFWRKILLGL